MTVGPFRVVGATPDTVTILEDGTGLKVSIDRCVRDPCSEEARQEQANPDKIPLPLETKGPVTDQSEIILRHEPDPTPTTPSTNDLQPMTIFSHFLLHH